MMAATHMLGYIVVMILYIQYMQLGQSSILAFSALSGLVGATIADVIDLKTPLISRLFKHRGIIHSIWIPLGLYVLDYFVNFPTILKMPIIFFNLGYISHLFLDSLTPTGIMPFTPFCNVKSLPYSLRIIKTNSWLETGVQFLFSISIAFLATGTKVW